MGHQASLRWKRLFPTWFAPFLSTFHHQAQRCWAPLYIQGLCSTAHLESIVPLAERVAPGQADPLQHFITDSPWTTDPLLRVLAQQANTLLGGKRAVLIIDDTCLTKFGSPIRLGWLANIPARLARSPTVSAWCRSRSQKTNSLSPWPFGSFYQANGPRIQRACSALGSRLPMQCHKPSGPWHSKSSIGLEETLSLASCWQTPVMAITLSSEKRSPGEGCSGRSGS